MAKPKYKTPLGKRLYVFAKKVDTTVHRMDVTSYNYMHVIEKLKEFDLLLDRIEQYFDEEVAPLTKAKVAMEDNDG